MTAFPQVLAIRFWKDFRHSCMDCRMSASTIFAKNRQLRQLHSLYATTWGGNTRLFLAVGRHRLGFGYTLYSIRNLAPWRQRGS